MQRLKYRTHSPTATPRALLLRRLEPQLLAILAALPADHPDRGFCEQQLATCRRRIAALDRHA